MNTQNPIDDLSIWQLQDIYTGKIQDWQLLWHGDFATHPVGDHVELVTKGLTHGTLDSFIHLLGMDETPKVERGRLHFKLKGSADYLPAGAQQVDRCIQAIGEVTHRPNAIAYDSIGAFDAVGDVARGVKLLKVEGVSPTVKNVEEHRYALVRPLNLLVNKNKVSANEQAYLNFILSPEGQRIVSQNNYIPISAMSR